MRLFSILALVVAVSFLGVGCSDKIDIAAPYKNITVVYGFLDQADTAHYVRIQKAFLDNNASALTMSQNADSSYYPQLNVMMERLDGNYNLIDTIHLTRVDLTAEGYPKPTGTFFNTPNYAYKFKSAVSTSVLFYRLVISNPLTGEVDSVLTPTLDDVTPGVFSVDKIVDTSVFNSYIDFNSTIAGSVLNLSGTYTPTNTNVANPVGILQGILRFNWTDSNSLQHTMTPQSVDVNLGYTAMNHNAFDFQVANSSLYTALANGMGPAPLGVYRLLGRCQLFVYISTNDFNTYVQVSEAAGTGLTGSSIEPTWTNIAGKNVLGLYTSRGSQSGYVTISVPTVDSLLISPLINPLCKLVNTTYH